MQKAQFPQMPIKVNPYRHQREAFEFACSLFGLTEEGGENSGENELRPLRKAAGTQEKPVSADTT